MKKEKKRTKRRKVEKGRKEKKREIESKLSLSLSLSLGHVLALLLEHLPLLLEVIGRTSILRKSHVATTVTTGNDTTLPGVSGTLPGDELIPLVTNIEHEFLFFLGKGQILVGDGDTIGGHRGSSFAHQRHTLGRRRRNTVCLWNESRHVDVDQLVSDFFFLSDHETLDVRHTRDDLVVTIRVREGGEFRKLGKLFSLSIHHDACVSIPHALFQVVVGFGQAGNQFTSTRSPARDGSSRLSLHRRLDQLLEGLGDSKTTCKNIRERSLYDGREVLDNDFVTRRGVLSTLHALEATRDENLRANDAADTTRDTPSFGVHLTIAPGLGTRKVRNIGGERGSRVPHAHTHFTIQLEVGNAVLHSFAGRVEERDLLDRLVVLVSLFVVEFDKLVFQVVDALSLLL